MDSKKPITTEELEHALEGLKDYVVSDQEILDNAKKLKEIFSQATSSLDEGEKRAVVDEFNQEISRLRNVMHRDVLTGLYNRRGISEEFGALFAEALFEKQHSGKRQGIIIKDFSIMCIDIDNLKEINDSYSWEAGDRVLKNIAELLKENVRKIDAVGRLAGGEFVVALVGADEEVTHQKAEEIRQLLLKKIKIRSDNDFKITASLGVASLHQSRAATLSQLVERAERAMIAAKEKGKNTVVRYSELREQATA